ncbi:hypothetical protein ND861_11630 [Leptospira sp. 2 VSF19]|uniref:Uncharacterized protein n=1 Tax=Leptospira soteropolitanensis TaxID=2950025 RepID=A0AAW5VCW3_9LEPT|nr:hypothetical protein [Leptospira soteropolitanensis]MCW7493044.1 hypothetical protein [Leptospira soteropolitanensis]MCW7500886.1 hypothetical protein [Leptospira soteropolitanensis]MCW7522895.1 hypothetical protein [Leptospira soteropolitanensis]MCW7526999.1 hypothetical protein [Leptospira soteropolitanensis]MCW7530613.1 hypothetical protein [Leptospira soteropolitanensis]
MSNAVRFPLVLILVFFAANLLVCRLGHKETTEGVFRMDDSVIRYVEALEAADAHKSSSKPSFGNNGLL